MGIFRNKTVLKIPDECRGMKIETRSSACTGEKTIGFFNRSTKQLMYAELVKSQSDIDAYYEKYGVEKDK